MHVPLDKAVLCLQRLLEGMWIRSTERVTGIHRDTIMSLLVHAGEKCERLIAKMRGLKPERLEFDEIWCYVAKKDKRVRPESA